MIFPGAPCLEFLCGWSSTDANLFNDLWICYFYECFMVANKWDVSYLVKGINVLWIVFLELLIMKSSSSVGQSYDASSWAAEVVISDRPTVVQGSASKRRL
ncbi:hypothetical protein PS2_041715 [Malus domestica]